MGEKVAGAGAGRFTDEERRGMAVALREMGGADGTMGFLREVVSKNGGCADLLLVIGLRSLLGEGDLYGALADAIDRPTCRAVQPCPGEFYECSACGRDSWADEESVTRYCPNCGSEVVS